MSDRNSIIESEINAHKSSLEYLNVKLELYSQLIEGAEGDNKKQYEAEVSRYQDQVEEERRKIEILESMKS